MSVSRDGESECRCDSILENTSDSNREEDQSKVDEGGSCSAALVAHIFFFSELEWGVLLPGLERRGRRLVRVRPYCMFGQNKKFRGGPRLSQHLSNRSETR